jgi:hypothetical protein
MSSPGEPAGRPRLLRREGHDSILPGMIRRRRQPPPSASTDGPIATSTTTSSSTITTSDDNRDDDEWVIEVGGEYQPLRLSEETEMAWAMGETVETSCLLCTIRLACIKDVDAVVCPECLSLSPLVLASGPPTRSASHRGGVGLGIQLA